MKKIKITEKLEEIEFPMERLSLGDFDQIGEFTARKTRGIDQDLYKTVGCYFRPNYERGILIYALIAKFQIESFLEIGVGRGYSAFCAAKSMCDHGIDGKVVTIDPNFDKEHLQQLTKVFPKDWFDRISFVSGTSADRVPTLGEQFDMVYIDGDHRYEAVKADWEMCQGLYKKFLLFDDYHLETKLEKDIECATLIDEIDDDSKELIIMDRRIFLDDRQKADAEIDYGQVLLTHPTFDTSEYILDW